MKKIAFTTFALALFVLLNGCLTTLHPIFKASDLIEDSRLIGKWKKSKDSSRTEFRKATPQDLSGLSATLQQNVNKVYIITSGPEPDSKEVINYFGFLIKLGRNYYMDFYPSPGKNNANADEFFKAHYIPLHSAYRIDFNSTGGFEMKQLNGDYLEKLVRNKQIRIKHEIMTNGDFMITAPTEDLQQYIAKYGDVPEAYDNADVYTKINY